MKELILGIDFGTSSVKIMCVSPDGVAGSASQPYENRSGLDPETDPES